MIYIKNQIKQEYTLVWICIFHPGIHLLITIRLDIQPPNPKKIPSLIFRIVVPFKNLPDLKIGSGDIKDVGAFGSGGK